MRGDGDGWAVGPDGAKRWGRHGAAGLLLRAPRAGVAAVLLQHRAVWSHHGGTWGLPGGARDSHESAAQAALREAAEETGVRSEDVTVRAERVTSSVPEGWSYTTVVADAAHELATERNGESAELRWVAEDAVPELELHPGLAGSWSLLRARPLLLVLDSRLPGLPDGLAAQRTVELPDRTFGWVSEIQVCPDPATAAHGRSGLVVVVTADRGLHAQLPPEVLAVEPAALTAWFG
ncbi:NUDIX domain-containing protein [Rhodococcus sp. X156]|uniref:NUDIX domain-containing protein n=1 Tax=Rhodococcus sp. X156 TaxID=2499145 RepID=UPI000FD819EF|nr:NUDIX domain-containing protein [Rhodococcus sp. X156]